MTVPPIIKMLRGVSSRAKTRFCMPGHKARKGFLHSIDLKYDITELSDADNLYYPSGAILKSQKDYAAYIGAGHSFYLVDGASCGVHAAVLSALKPGDEVIVARDFHLSAPHAFALAGVKVNYVSYSVDKYGSILPLDLKWLAQAVKKFTKAKAVYVTYPDYFGRCTDLKAVADIAHSAGMMLICDAAHAAAFDFSNLLPVSPAVAGADIWTVSLHKTLPAINQSAALLLGRGSAIAEDTALQRLNMLRTTSPSYIIMGSIDYALNYMYAYGGKMIAQVISQVSHYKTLIENLGGYTCFYSLEPYGCDPLKLVIDVSARGVTGFEAAKKLESDGIYAETADLTRVLFIITVMDKDADFKRLLKALKSITGTGKTINYTISTGKISTIYDVFEVTDMRTAVFSKRQRIPLLEATGRVSAVCAGAYPPGIPLLVPGQLITGESINYLNELRRYGYSLFGCDDHIYVIAKD